MPVCDAGMSRFGVDFAAFAVDKRLAGAVERATCRTHPVNPSVAQDRVPEWEARAGRESSA
ncbi:MAG: hypothetical protein P4L98_11655 [Ancalomicrobiaceae bacterium]|nr:hypothetical protein [Ancalomicrobiaceae bacterium]